MVGSRHGGIPEIVEHGVNGLMCEENDVDDLIAKLEQIIGMADEWGEIGRAGRRTVEQNHSLTRATDGTLHAYRSALAYGSPALR